MEVVVFAVAGVALVLAAIWLGNRTLRSDDIRSSGIGDAFGNYIDVFDPAQARAQRDRKSQESQGAIIPSPDGDDPPIKIDLRSGQAVIDPRSLRRETPPATPEP